MDLLDQPAHALSEAIRRRELSCRELMRATLERIAAVNPRHNAIVSLREPDALLREADARDTQLERGATRSESIGWLHGLPQAIKDTAHTAGLRTTLGSRVLRNFVPAQDGLLVQRMKAAGCIVIGKTNVPEFGLGSHTFNEVFGVTGNAYDPSRSAGGSSGGAAVAVATRMLSVADGSDFMGSLRNPAGWNNVFGFRPSRGRVPTWPAEDVWVTQLSTEGPMGRTVRDVALLLDVQAGYDARAPLSLAKESERFADSLARFDAKGVRIGWLGDLGGYLAVEDGVLECCTQALRRLAGCGCAIEPAEAGFAPEEVWEAWLVWRRWLVAARIAPHLSDPANRALIKPEALWEHDQAAHLSGVETYRASAQRSAFYQRMLALLERADFLALPSAQVWPFDAALRWPSSIAGRAMDTYHRWMEVTIYATFAGLPCISVPAGFGGAGLPMGLQLIGRPRDDAGVLGLARVYEQAAQDVLKIKPRSITDL
ncbi:MAG TPA: amidase [Casimicrobiaceae bacterium]|nr:amidase [Casimicrobiaceae bacterium]